MKKTTTFTLHGKVLHLPDWLPGSWIRREAKEARVLRDKMVDTPYQYVQKRMVSIEWVRNQLITTGSYRCSRSAKST